MNATTIRPQEFVTTLLPLVCCLGMAVLSSKASTLVVPNGLDAREGTGSSGILNQAGREQTVYASANFPNGPISIQALHFRPNVTDYMPGSAFSTTIWDLQIVLSTTSVQPGALSPTFHDNTGPNAQTVVSGAVVLFSTFTGPDAGPKDFDIIIPLNEPFTYNPAQGNLLVDIQNSSGDPTSPVDAEYATNGAASRVVSGSPISSTGVPDADGDVLQIAYSQLGSTNPPPISPAILSQPISETVSVGETALFTVVAGGAAPLNYQWFFDGTNALAGATNDVLEFLHAQTSQAGAYTVEVYNSFGMTNSQPATLTVNPGPAATNGYITAVLRSACTSAPTPPPPVGATNIGPDYVIMTVADASPTNFAYAEKIVTDAVFESLMPLYCDLSTNSGVGCVSSQVQWNIITYDTNGNPVISGCAASGCASHDCGGSGIVTASPALAIAPATNSIGLQWPSAASDFILEASSNLADWYPVDPPLITNGTQVSVQMPTPGQGLFYRLRHK